MRARPVHAIVDTFGLAVELAFDLQRGIAVGHYADVPSRSVVPVALGTISENFRRCFAFIAGTKRTEASLETDWLTDEVVWALRTLRRNDHPASGDRIYSYIRQ